MSLSRLPLCVVADPLAHSSDICTRHKKIFTHEHQIYTSSTLQQHYRGTNTSEPAFKGHPECGFCHTRFYGDDELWEHCRDKHEECFICVRRGIRHRYYMDYSRLADHFETEHYACKHPSCLERKFVVFENEIELKAHDVETHGASAGGSKKAFRKVELELPPRRQTPTLEREQRRPSPAPSSAQQQPLQTAFPPLSAPAPTPAAASAAAEPKASQRRLKPPPGFGSQLTQTAPAAGAASSSSAAGSAEIPAALQDIFGNDARKYTEFRSLAQAYKGSIITADEFVRSMVGLATEGLTDDRVIREKEADIGRVWTRMAETAPAGTGTRSGLPRKEDMLRAWKEYKLSRSQFPDLPTPASSRPGASSSESINRGTYSATANPRITTVNNSKADRARVLVIKSNARKHTATVPSQPKRSVYDQIAEEALRRNSSRDERFEQDREERELLQRAATEGATLPESRVQVLSRNEFEERKAILEGRPGPSSSSSEHSAAPRWTKASSSAHEFPSLPAATKPVRLGRGSASSSAWSAQADQPVDEPPSESGDGRKKNKKKQVLMKIGL